MVSKDNIDNFDQEVKPGPHTMIYMDTVKGEDDHEGAEHWYCAARPDHTATHRQIARTTLYIYIQTILIHRKSVDK